MADDTLKRAKAWVKEQRKQGISEADIKEHLNDKGYPQNIINSAMRKSFNWIYVLVPLVIIALGIGIYLALPSISSLFSKTCLDDNCFITAANSCENARLSKADAGGIFSYSTKECVLTKTMAKMNDSEPPEIKTLLGGKSMTCPYSAGDFNEEWITALSLGIDECSGDLKDAINELVASL